MTEGGIVLSWKSLRCSRGAVAAAAFSCALIVVGCGGGSDVVAPPGGGGGPPPGPPVTTALSCVQPDGTFTQCDLTLEQAGGFSIQSASTSCQVHGNQVLLTKPESTTLTNDGCYDAAGKTYSYPGPYPAGTQISFRIISAKLANPSGLHATGAFPSWDLLFEDGGDMDYNDIILKVAATQ